MMMLIYEDVVVGKEVKFYVKFGYFIINNIICMFFGKRLKIFFRF